MVTSERVHGGWAQGTHTGQCRVTAWRHPKELCDPRDTFQHFLSALLSNALLHFWPRCYVFLNHMGIDSDK